MERIIILLLLSALIFGGGCNSILPGNSISPNSISEISMGGHTGLGNSGFEITLFRDGTARFRCTFYNVDKEPETNSMQVTMIKQCGHFYKNNRSSFKKVSTQNGGANLEGVFNGKVSLEQFDRLTELIVRNGYFSMQDKYEVSGLMDAPPTHTRVVYSGGEKKISNQGGKGGEKLKEIQDAIYATPSEITWQ